MFKLTELRAYVSQSLRAYRIEQGMTQEEVADQAEMNPSHLGKIERGQDNATIDVVDRIIRAMNATYHDVFK